MNDATHIKSLLRQSLFTPADAAHRLLAMDLPRQWLWMALALMSVLNSIVYSVGIRLSAPTDPAAMAMIPPIFQSPLLFTIFLFGGLVITVFTLTWVGQSLGGKARLGDILIVISWMQVLRLLLQAAITVLGLISAQVATMLVFVGSFWGIFILTGFINTAHGFGNWFKAFCVMLLAGLAMAVGLTIIMTVIGGAIMGIG